MNSNAQTLLANAADAVVGSWPRRQPETRRLEQVGIVAHRGAHADAGHGENTIAAFDEAIAAGVWGLECDIRYTADGEPVISHDPDLKRVFDNPSIIANTAWSNLRDRVSGLVHLEDFIDRYTGRAHYMLELKARAPGIGEARLLRLLGQLEPGTDFHILALDTKLFAAVRELPGRCRLPVATLNARHMLDYTLSHDCAGLAGHYVTLGLEQVLELQAAGLHIGTGLVPNRNVLWREINRGVEWIFSDHAATLQRCLDDARSGP